jgi:hypothetical protein
MINNSELLEIKGGATKYFYGIGIGAIVSFIVGVVDGYMRPLSCHR